jgi:ribosome-binding factor A
MGTRRIARVNDLIREEISDMLMHDVKDPRICGLFTVTEVHTSADLKHAKVFISVMGSEDEKKKVEEGLAAASGFLRHCLAERLTLRYVPELNFQRDDSIEKGSNLLRLINEVAPSDDVHEME